MDGLADAKNGKVGGFIIFVVDGEVRRRRTLNPRLRSNLSLLLT